MITISLFIFLYPLKNYPYVIKNICSPIKYFSSIVSLDWLEAGTEKCSTLLKLIKKPERTQILYGIEYLIT